MVTSLSSLNPPSGTTKLGSKVVDPQEENAPNNDTQNKLADNNERN